MENKEVEQEILTKITKLGKDKAKVVAIKHNLNLIKQADEFVDKQSDQIQGKYDTQSLPIFEKADQIISGQSFINEIPNEFLAQLLSDQDIQAIKSEAVKPQPLKDYWLTVFKNADLDELTITEKDEAVFKTLTKVEIKWAENMVDFKVVFHFGANEYFKNATLSKEFFHEENELMKVIGTKVEWNDGKNLTKKTVKKKQKNKKSGQQRTIMKEVDDDSFFHFFRTVDLSDKVKFEKLSEDEQIDLQEHLEIDHEMGRLLIDELIPYSLEYFLGLKELGEKHESESEEEEEEDSEEEAPMKVKAKPHTHNGKKCTGHH